MQHDLERSLAERASPGSGVRDGGGPAPPVGGLGHHLALDQLRREVTRRTDHQAGLREPEVVGGLGDAEVDHHRLAVEHHHVARLQVAVDHPGLVDRLQRLGEAAGQREPALRGQRTTVVHLLVQWAAGDEPGDQVGPVVAQVVVEDAGDTGVVDLLQGGRLAFKARASGRVVGDVRPQDLQRHLFVDRALGQVHDPHTALAEPADQLVRPDRLVHHGGSIHVYRCGRTAPCH